MRKKLREFLASEAAVSNPIDNERALQLEIGMMFRQNAFDVQFEKSCRNLASHPEHTKKQKRDIDLLVSDKHETLAIELKAPFAGRVPETMYDFFSDIAFMEAVVRSGIANRGVCLMLTNDQAYWNGPVTSGIYKPLRVRGSVLNGVIAKPTGKKDSAIVISGTYSLEWCNLGNSKLLPNGRYTFVEIETV